MSLQRFRKLQNSGLPYDFTTVVYGWRKGHLTREQLIDYAMDQIGYCAPEIEGKVVELAFADPTDEWTLNRLADELASDTPGDQQRAGRTWRYILLSDFLKEWRQSAEQSKNTPQAKFDWDWYVSIYHEIEWFCSHCGIDDAPPYLEQPSKTAQKIVIPQDLLNKWLQEIELYQNWLAEERTELLKDKV